jgi:hypothetical protein
MYSRRSTSEVLVTQIKVAPGKPNGIKRNGNDPLNFFGGWCNGSAPRSLLNPRNSLARSFAFLRCGRRTPTLRCTLPVDRPQGNTCGRSASQVLAFPDFNVTGVTRMADNPETNAPQELGRTAMHEGTARMSEAGRAGSETVQRAGAATAETLRHLGDAAGETARRGARRMAGAQDELTLDAARYFEQSVSRTRSRRIWRGTGGRSCSCRSSAVAAYRI